MVEQVEVTQADRDAAAPILELYGAKNYAEICRAQVPYCDNLDIVQAFARHRLAALQPAQESYIAFQQRRGRLPDLIEEVIGIYDDFMLDDDYNTQGCLDKIAAKLRSARDWYTATPLPAAPEGE